MYDADKRTLDPQVRMLAAREVIRIENDEPTDAEIEAAASAMFDVADEQMRSPTKFDRAPDPLADTYRRMARAAIIAARTAARHE